MNDHVPHIGKQICYDLEGVIVGRKRLEKLVNTFGFADYMPKPVTPTERATRAVKSWINMSSEMGGLKMARGAMNIAQDLDGDGRSSTLQVDKATPKGEWNIVFTTIKTVNWTDLGLEWAAGVRIFVHKQSGQIICTRDASGALVPGSEDAALAAEIEPHWIQWGETHTARDVSVMVKAIIDSMNAFPIRRDGGVYFVPATEDAGIDRLRALVNALPWIGRRQPSFRAMRIVDATAERGDAAAAAHEELMGELDRLSAELDEQCKSKTVMATTIGSRLIEYQKLLARATIYTNALGMMSGSIQHRVDEMQQKAFGALAAMNAAKAAARNGGSNGHGEPMVQSDMPIGRAG